MENIKENLSRLEQFLLSESLGRVESLIEIPDMMTRSSLSSNGIP